MRRLVLVVLLAGCAPSASSGEGDAATETHGFTAAPDPLASDAALGARAAQVFASCGGSGGETSCHSTGAGGTYLKLGANGDVVGVPSSEDPSMLRVKPGDPAQSYLYEKLLDVGDYDGGRMPLGGPYDPRLAPFIATWIDGGAPSP